MPAAMAKYRVALDIDASDVAVLGELGWAAFKAGELEDAHRHDRPRAQVRA